MSDKKQWSKEEIEDFIQKEDLRYQRISLPFHLQTDGADRRPTADLIFSADMNGKSVLDIGCKFGFFCFEALKKGAVRTLGVDIDSECVRKSETIASMLGLKAQFKYCDVEKTTFPEPFDYVLCLNILHHLKDPLHTLDSLIKWTKDTLVIEIAGVKGRDRAKFNLTWLQEKMLKDLPVVFISDTKLNVNTNQNCFFTYEALANAIRNRTNSFANIEKVESPHKGRCLLVAKKRKINKLIVVSGPTSSGKSTFIADIMEGNIPEILTQCRESDLSKAFLTTNTKIHLHKDVNTDLMIYHYDMLKSFHFPGAYFENDPSLNILLQATEIFIYTLWTEPDRLREQLYENEIKRRSNPRKKHLRVQKMYEDDKNIRNYYRSWLRYLRSSSLSHTICSYKGKKYSVLNDDVLDL